VKRSNHPSTAQAGRGAGRAERWGAIFVAVLILVVPAIVMPSARDSFALPKLVAAQALGLASLLVLSFELFPAGRIAPWRLPVVRAVFPLLLVATSGLLFSPHRAVVATAVVALTIGSACLVGWSAGIRARGLYTLLALLAIPATLLAAVGLLQASGLFQPFALSVASGNRMAVTSLAGNVGTLGAFLVLPILIAQARVMKTRRWSLGWWWYLAVIAISFAALVATRTLTPLLAAGMGTACLWFVRLPRRRWLGLAAALVVSATLLAVGVAPVRSRVLAKWDAVRHGEVNALLTGRLDGWRAALWMFERHPLLGVGQGAFVTEFIPAKRALLAAGVKFDVYQFTPVFSHAHNELLEVAAELGLLGLAALGWGLFILARTIRGVRTTTGPERALLWGGLAALAVLSLADFPFRLALVGYPAVLFLAWVFRFAAESEGR